MTDQTFPKELYVRFDNFYTNRTFLYADDRKKDVLRTAGDGVVVVATYKLEKVENLKLVVTEKVETVEGENV